MHDPTKVGWLRRFGSWRCGQTIIVDLASVPVPGWRRACQAAAWITGLDRPGASSWLSTPKIARQCGRDRAEGILCAEIGGVRAGPLCGAFGPEKAAPARTLSPG
jgi:hypothetical protein